MANNLSSSEDYRNFLQELKERILQSQVRAVLSVNRELVLLYWQIGQDILNRQQQQGWGAKIIDNLAADLQKAFPQMKGFSSRNLKYMRSFAETYPDEQFVQEVLAQITWYHNIALMEKLKSPDERLWYARQTIEQGWSRNVLVHLKPPGDPHYIGTPISGGRNGVGITKRSLNAFERRRKQ
ncbi:MAG: DUF1016 N-terminal domain-containing protein [Microcoleus sp.]